jgi:hypothetical protein
MLQRNSFHSCPLSHNNNNNNNNNKNNINDNIITNDLLAATATPVQRNYNKKVQQLRSTAMKQTDAYFSDKGQ